MKVNSATSPTTINTAMEMLRGNQGVAHQGWSDIVHRIGTYVHQGLRPGLSPAGQVEQLSGLLKLQVDITRYQLRVELVSKVGESAVASMRKLQQNQ